MTAEIIARVDAWLARQTYAWLTPERCELVGAWVTLKAELRDSAEAKINRAGYVAALTGILLALVREAWGDPTIYARPLLGGWKMTDGEGNSLWPAASGPLPRDGTEADTLVAALEATTPSLEGEFGVRTLAERMGVDIG